jgi:hypothetical protein
VRPSLSAWYRAYWIAVSFGKKRFEKKDVEAILQRLDRLTQDEAETTVTEILKVVHGLAQNMNVIMDGKQTLSGSPNIY